MASISFCLDESDYSVPDSPPRVEFQPGSTKETLLLLIENDNIYEETQSFTLSISSTENERILFQPENHTTVNILDNEEIFVGFNKPFYTAVENDGKVLVGLNIILPSGGSEVMVNFTVTITAMNGTAIGIFMFVICACIYRALNGISEPYVLTAFSMSNTYP